VRTWARAVLGLWLAASASAQPAEPEKLIEAGHWKRARAIVDARLGQAPNDALSNFLLSQIRAAFGDRVTPLPLAEKAVALDGRVAKYHRQVAEVLGVTAQHSNALKQLFLARRFRQEIDQALALDPKDTQAQRDLLEYDLLAPVIVGGDVKKAAATAERIAALDPAEGFLAQARVAEYQHQNADAEKWLRKAAALPNYKTRILLAQFYLAPEHFNAAGAENQARYALALDRSRAGAYAILAEVYAARAQWADLDATLAEATRQVPDDAAPYYRAASRLLADGRDPERAERYLRVYLAQEPEGNEPPAAEAHWKLGLALEAMGRKNDAVAEWNEAVRLDHDSPAVRELRRVRGVRSASAF